MVVPELSVSRRHAAIMKSDEGLYVRDLSSSNGTFVNRTNITVEDHLLSDADRIQLGVSETSFVFKGPAAPAR